MQATALPASLSSKDGIRRKMISFPIKVSPKQIPMQFQPHDPCARAWGLHDYYAMAGLTRAWAMDETIPAADIADYYRGSCSGWGEREGLAEECLRGTEL